MRRQHLGSRLKWPLELLCVDPLEAGTRVFVRIKTQELRDVVVDTACDSHIDNKVCDSAWVLKVTHTCVILICKCEMNYQVPAFGFLLIIVSAKNLHIAVENRPRLLRVRPFNDQFRPSRFLYIMCK